MDRRTRIMLISIFVAVDLAVGILIVYFMARGG